MHPDRPHRSIEDKRAVKLSVLFGIAEEVHFRHRDFLPVLHPVKRDDDVVLGDMGDHESLAADANVRDPCLLEVVARIRHGFAAISDTKDRSLE